MSRPAQVRSFEALLRWPHPTARPDRARNASFRWPRRPASSSTSASWVLRAACRSSGNWPNGISVAVNLSPLQFRNPSLLGNGRRCARSQRPRSPRRLELEITETALLSAEARNREILRALAHLGVRVSIDDFGTGYSSMSYLQNFEVDKIKIDKRFVQGLDNGLERGCDHPGDHQPRLRHRRGNDRRRRRDQEQLTR